MTGATPGRTRSLPIFEEAVLDTTIAPVCHQCEVWSSDSYDDWPHECENDGRLLVVHLVRSDTDARTNTLVCPKHAPRRRKMNRTSGDA